MLKTGHKQAQQRCPGLEACQLAKEAERRCRSWMPTNAGPVKCERRVLTHGKQLLPARSIGGLAARRWAARGKTVACRASALTGKTQGAESASEPAEANRRIPGEAEAAHGFNHQGAANSTADEAAAGNDGIERSIPHQRLP